MERDRFLVPGLLPLSDPEGPVWLTPPGKQSSPDPQGEGLDRIRPSLHSLLNRPPDLLDRNPSMPAAFVSQLGHRYQGLSLPPGRVMPEVDVQPVTPHPPTRGEPLQQEQVRVLPHHLGRAVTPETQALLYELAALEASTAEHGQQVHFHRLERGGVVEGLRGLSGVFEAHDARFGHLLRGLPQRGHCERAVGVPEPPGSLLAHVVRHGHQVGDDSLSVVGLDGTERGKLKLQTVLVVRHPSPMKAVGDPGGEGRATVPRPFRGLLSPLLISHADDHERTVLGSPCRGEEGGGEFGVVGVSRRHPIPL